MPALRPELSFCDIGGRLVFLDLHRDRYFCLEDDAERGFRAIMRGERSVADAVPTPLDRLFSIHANACPVACRPPPQPRESRWDAPLPRAASAETALALGALGLARVRIALGGLSPAIKRLERRRSAATADAQSTTEAAALLAPFAAASRLVSSRDACLPFSLAIAERLIGAGQATMLIIGVRLGPFAAHCWVQQGDVVMNDRTDVVRTFTPILVA